MQYRQTETYSKVGAVLNKCNCVGPRKGLGFPQQTAAPGSPGMSA